MNGLTVRYKKKGWTEWVYWPCSSEEEAAKVIWELKKQGYEVER